MSYLLSIIIPTKNRYIYLKSILKTFAEIDTGDIELVIQDNSDDNKEILDFLSSNYSENINYCYYQKHMSVSDNFNLGILNSTGMYVCMIGDDDNFSIKIIEVAKYMKENEIESTIFNKASYNWTDIKFRIHKIPNLTIPKCTGMIKKINPEIELIRCLNKGTTTLLKLPEIYHGIVKRTTLNKIYDKCNTFFPGASPDMACAISLSLIVKSHVYIDAPYTISGHGYDSAGGKGARHAHKGRLNDVAWLPDDIEETWESKIPMVWTGATIYAETAHKALVAMGREDLIKKFNYPYQCAFFLVFDPQYRNYLKPLLKGKVCKKAKVFLNMIKVLAKRINVFIRNYFTANLKLTRNQIYEDILTSHEASKIVDEFIETQVSKKIRRQK